MSEALPQPHASQPHDREMYDVVLEDVAEQSLGHVSESKALRHMALIYWLAPSIRFILRVLES